MIASKLSAAGLWPSVGADVARIAAAGTNGLDGTRFDLADTVIVGSGTGAVVMRQTGQTGDEMQVINATGAAVALYVVTPGKINNAVTPFSLVAAHCYTLKCLKAGNWFVTGDFTITGTIPADDEPATEEAPPSPPAEEPTP